MSPKTKSKTKPEAALADLSFEQAFAELEQIVGQLEAGQVTLDQALALFERGQQLNAHCGQLLDNAELKIQTLTPRPGGYQLQDFEPAEA
jgi:exodeoxyribonuclease VII small subunit